MRQDPSPQSWRRNMVALFAAAALVWIVVGEQSSGLDAAQTIFMGGTPSQVDAEAITTSRLLFPAGVRSNWHTHTWGQLLMLEEGSGRHQVRGGPVTEMLPGEPWWTPAGVEHWHGAAPDEDALQLTIYEGAVEWLEPVLDEAYLVDAVRP